MDYEQKYKDALRRAKKLYGQGTITECLGWVFPEIKESKDERIRKTLIAFFRDWERTKSHCWNVNVTDIIAWLEKQGIQPTDKAEDYCSKEVVKLLKEKGFKIQQYYNSLINMWQDTKVTHQMAMKWLREECDLHIIAYPYNANGKKKWCCQVYKAFNLLGNEKYVNETLDSYEEAVEAALKYCLTII